MAAAPHTTTKTIVDFLRPSAGGVFMYCLLVILTLLVRNGPGFRQVFGPVDDLHLGTRFVSWLNTLLTGVLGDRSGALVLSVFWAVVGVLVAMLVMMITSTIGGFDEALEERRYIVPRGSDPNAPLKNFFIRTIFRIGMAVLLVIFVLAALRLLGQSVPPLLRGVGGHDGYTVVAANVLFVVLEMVCLHISVLLLRMVALRYRLFD